MEYHSAIKKKIMPFVATWMDLEIFILNEVCHADKNKYYKISLIAELKKICKEIIYKIEVDSQT